MSAERAERSVTWSFHDPDADVRACGCPVNAYHSADCVWSGQREPDEPGEAHTGTWRVFSNGDPRDVRIFAPDGHEVTHVRRVTYSIGAGEMPELVLEVMPSAITTVGGVTVVPVIECPACRESINHECKGPPF